LRNYEAWLVTHRPILGLDDGTHPPEDLEIKWISTQLAYASIGLLGTYSTILSAYIHLNWSLATEQLCLIEGMMARNMFEAMRLYQTLYPHP